MIIFQIGADGDVDCGGWEGSGGHVGGDVVVGAAGCWGDYGGRCWGQWMGGGVGLTGGLINDESSRGGGVIGVE